MNSEDGVQSEEQKPKHSGYGIASFSILIVNGLLICSLFIYVITTQDWIFAHRQASPTESLIMGTLGVAVIGWIHFGMGWRTPTESPEIIRCPWDCVQQLAPFCDCFVFVGLRPHAMSALKS